MGRYKELRLGKAGKMTEFWDRHYNDPEKIPQKSYAGIPLLTDHPGHFLSDFTLQFATYLCADVNHSEAYKKYLTNSFYADKLWFTKHTQSSRYWGLGAGEVRFHDPKENSIRSAYHADSLENNPHLMVSPHIIAGFLPVNPEGIKDLLSLYKNHECTYDYRGKKLLWRCSLENLSLPIDRLQAIDFSTMPIGLSTLDPKINGLRFFQRFAPGAPRKNKSAH